MGFRPVVGFPFTGFIGSHVGVGRRKGIARNKRTREVFQKTADVPSPDDGVQAVIDLRVDGYGF